MMSALSDKITGSKMWLIGIIVFMGITAHSSMLPATFKTLDDSFSIIKNENVRGSDPIQVFRSSFFERGHYYRPFVSLSFWAENQLFGLKSFFYNLTNLLLHLSIAVSVFFLIHFILKDRGVAFFTSLLFAVHPIQWEAVANIPGRAVILSTFFTVNAFLCYFLAQEKKRSVLFYGLSLVLFACGLLSKESAAMFPVLLLSYIFLVDKDKKKYIPVIFYFAVIAVYLVIRLSLGYTETYPWRNISEFILGVITFLRAGLTYLRLLVWPVDLHFDRAREMFLSFVDPEFWATLITYLVGLFIILRSKKSLKGTTLFFIAWFCIELIPVSQVVTSIGVQPGYISAAEHFLYMPVIGAFALLVLAVKGLFEFNLKKNFCSANLLRAVAAGFLLFFVLITVRQGYEARTPVTMFRRTLFYNPRNVRIQYSMGLEMVAREQFAAAEIHFRNALMVDPFHLKSYLALGRTLHDQGRFVEALAVYEGIDDAGQWDELLTKNLDEAYAAAVGQYERMIFRSPNDAVLHYSLGSVYSRSGQVEKGIEQYRIAVAINPVHKDALFNMASSYEALGQDQLAVETYERMIAVDTGQNEMDRFAFKQIAGIYRRLGDEVKAQEYDKKFYANMPSAVFP